MPDQPIPPLSMEPDELDGVIAAGQHHKVIFENDRVRVIETAIPVGEITDIHTHRRPTTLHVVSGDHFVRRDAAGDVEFDTRTQTPDFDMPRILWTEDNPPHTIENVGSADLVFIGVEIKG